RASRETLGWPLGGLNGHWLFNVGVESMRRKSESIIKWIFLAGTFLSSVLALPAADLAAKTGPDAATLFDDPVLAKGKGVEIKQSQVDEMYAAFRANRATAGQAIPESQRPKIEADILERLIATQLCVQRATDADKAKAQQIAKEFIAEQIKQVP